MSEHVTSTVEFDPTVLALETSTVLDEEDQPTFYENHYEWVANWLASTIQANLSNNKRWCATWWKHPEATTRLIALWGAWEEAQASPELSARSNWWVHHFAPHWSALTASDGPFIACKQDNHTSGKPLPVATAQQDLEVNN